jgi:hypothetical protein
MTGETLRPWWVAVLTVALILVPMLPDWQCGPVAFGTLSVDDGVEDYAVLAIAADSPSSRVRSPRIGELWFTMASPRSSALVEVHLSRPPPRLY